MTIFIISIYTWQKENMDRKSYSSTNQIGGTTKKEVTRRSLYKKAHTEASLKMMLWLTKAVVIWLAW